MRRGLLSTQRPLKTGPCREAASRRKEQCWQCCNKCAQTLRIQKGMEAVQSRQNLLAQVFLEAAPSSQGWVEVPGCAFPLQSTAAAVLRWRSRAPAWR